MLSLKDDVIILSTGDGDRRDKCHYQPAGDQSLTISISFRPPRGFTRGVSPDPQLQIDSHLSLSVSLASANNKFSGAAECRAEKPFTEA